ncbi:MAG: ATP-binding protein [Alphaproteobacteria bacterium]|nr:ATP-binding protein [Alphaproteobacteria bacterium]
MTTLLFERYVRKRIEEALEDTRVVLVSGPRQSGKTTLIREISGPEMEFFTLDDATTLDAARSDPVGFLRGIDRAVIDEVQRAPELLLAIKTEVDRDKRPGRFLLTGSANLLKIPKVADSLAGRMETVPLLPLAQSEILGSRSSFIDNMLSGNRPKVGECILGADLVEAVLRGGYPEALARVRWPRRQNWYVHYIDAIVQRDIRDIAHIEQLAAMPRLLRMISEHAGQLVNYSSIGSAAGMNHVTTHKYLRVFESLFIVDTVQPWYTNKLKRLTKSPKLHFLDAGLLAAMRGITPAQVLRDRTAFGAILETFIYSEIRKIASWSEQQSAVFHFRDRDGMEVDIVIDTPAGAVAGIEIKAAASVSSEDFKGLRKLREAVGDRFLQGLVLYDGEQVVPAGDGLFAAPISCLWSS